MAAASRQSLQALSLAVVRWQQQPWQLRRGTEVAVFLHLPHHLREHAPEDGARLRYPVVDSKSDMQPIRPRHADNVAWHSQQSDLQTFQAQLAYFGWTSRAEENYVNEEVCFLKPTISDF